MAAKLCIVLSLCACACALPVLQYEPEAPAHYEFSYSVHDSHTGDLKQQEEARAGDAVHGSYSLLQPDGVRRIVHYTADKEHGFNAEVAYEGHPTEAPAKLAYAAPVAKVAYAAPVAKLAYAPAPVYYAAPVAKLAYAAQPAAHYTFTSPAISYHH